MDEQDSERIDSCGICFEPYNDNLRPRVLPCGHCYCTTCLNLFLKERRLTCPYCKTTHGVANTGDLPINYSLEMTISYVRKIKVNKETKSVKDFHKEFKRWLPYLDQQIESLYNICKYSGNACTDMVKYKLYLRDKRLRHETLVTDICELVDRHKEVVKLIEAEEEKVDDLIQEGYSLSSETSTKFTYHKNASSIKEIILVEEKLLKWKSAYKEWKKKYEALPDVALIKCSDKITDDTVDALQLVAVTDDGMAVDNPQPVERSLPIMDTLETINKEAMTVKIGDRVVRGRDWKWKNQDGPLPSIGTVSKPPALDGWIDVTWDTGTTNCYRNGAQGKYDLQLAGAHSTR